MGLLLLESLRPQHAHLNGGEHIAGVHKGRETVRLGLAKLKGSTIYLHEEGATHGPAEKQRTQVG